MSAPPEPVALCCALCRGVLDPQQPGAVLHLLLRLVTEPNPHDGWWRDHPQGPRFLCDACYAAALHPLLAGSAEPYVGRYQAAPHPPETEGTPSLMDEIKGDASSA